jgi:hypothetical protein
MNKKIIISLLIIANTTCHGMELTPNNIQTLSHFTKQLCAEHHYNPHSLKNDIRALYETNTFFHDYYAQEEVQQNIIKRCAYYHYSNGSSSKLNYYANDKDFAGYLQCRAVQKKIERFINIARSEKLKFNEADLKETWYLTLTSNRNDNYNYSHTYKKDISLLGIALHYRNFKAVHNILDYVQQLDFYYGDLYELTQMMYFECDSQCLPIAQKIVSKKAPSMDSTDKRHGYSALLKMVELEDEKLTRFFLENGINPYARPSNTPHLFYSSIFDCNDSPICIHIPRIWFQEIVTQIEETRAPLKYWLLKNYTPDGYPIIPQELALLIIYTLKTTLSQIDQSVLK